MNNLLKNIIKWRGLNMFYSPFANSSSFTAINLFTTSEIPLKRSLVVFQQNLLLSKETLEGKTNKKEKDAIRITLYGPDHSITVTTLEHAQHISKRRELKLVKIEDLDPKTQRPVYRLYTPAELIAEETAELKSTDQKSKSTKKTEKNLTLSSRIGEHDLQLRIKNIHKWLSKGYEVRALIQGTSEDDPNTEKVFSIIDTALKEQKEGRIVQKRNKFGNIKFNILPTANKNESS